MDPNLLFGGILLSLAGTCAAAVLSLAARGKGGRRLAMLTLAAATGAGAVVSCAALVAPPELSAAPSIYGVRLTFDALTAVFFAILNAVACAVSLYAIAYVDRYADVYDVRRLDALTAVFILGMQGVLLAATPLGFLAFWEIMSIGSFFLVMADKQPASLRAALFYLIMTHLGAGAILAGFMLLSGGAPAMGFAGIAAHAQALPSAALSLAFVLMLFGFGSKAGLWPFHVWLPEAHPQAPSHISALMSGVMLKMALYGFLRMLLTVFPPIPAGWTLPIIALGLLSAIFGALYAIVERDIKRLLAYSSIENLGLMFTMVGASLFARAVGQAALANAALAAAVLHAAAHAIFKSGLFMGAGAIVHQLHTRDLESMGGLAKRMPKFSGAMLVLALGAAALPPSAAFMSEWLLLQNVLGAVGSASPFAQGVLIVILSGAAFVGGLAVFAMVKMFGIAFLAQPRGERAARAHEPSLGLAIPVFSMAALTLAVGLGAPYLLKTIGFRSATDGVRLVSGGGALYPLALALVFAAVAAAAVLARRRFSDAKLERSYHTWDCGQPIDATMEYTATAFSAPMRFFFRPLLRTRKEVKAVPVVGTNPWIARHESVLEVRQIWYELIYAPIARAALFLSTQARRLHSGVIQFYIALIVAALVATLAIAL
ncbi:MAG TPA: proton-conducting transporter membrane subunit [Patescibacteria group bacterium]|nr:proton-conducting transporter membrane subunit [Patescibacteria group bacterium]